MTLSIITINYNNREGLQRTIDSVLAQTWKDFEWIVIDGGSTDGSRELIEQYHKHFAYWCSEPDKGVYNAMNKGIARAKGEYLNFMNSGDTFYEEETLKKVFNKSRNADVLYGDCMQVFGNRTELSRYPQCMELYALYGRPICHQTMMIRSQLLKDSGYDESYRICADYKHSLEMAMRGATFEHVGTVVCRYDMSGISSQRTEAFDREWNASQKVLPKMICYSMEHLHGYAGSRHTLRAKNLLNKGGLVTLITKAVLAFLDKLFIRTNIKDYPYCD